MYLGSQADVLCRWAGRNTWHANPASQWSQQAVESGPELVCESRHSAVGAGCPSGVQTANSNSYPQEFCFKKIFLIFMCFYLFKGQGKREKKRDLSSTDEMAWNSWGWARLKQEARIPFGFPMWFLWVEALESFNTCRLLEWVAGSWTSSGGAGTGVGCTKPLDFNS